MVFVQCLSSDIVWIIVASDFYGDNLNAKSLLFYIGNVTDTRVVIPGRRDLESHASGESDIITLSGPNILPKYRRENAVGTNLTTVLFEGMQRLI